MAKRVIVPKVFPITVSGGSGQVDLDFALPNLPAGTISGWLTYLVVKTALGGNPKGKIRIRDLDISEDIALNPKPGRPTIFLTFHSQEMRIPVNGNYSFHLDQANDGDYTVILTLEEKPRGVVL